MKNFKTILLALIAVIATVAVLWFTNRTITPRDATMDDVVAEAELGGYRLITTSRLAEHYNKNPESVLLVDTRQEWEYRTGHIKGAVNFPMEPTWMSRWKKKNALEMLIGSDKNRFVVFY